MNKAEYVNRARENLDYALDQVSYFYKKKAVLEKLKESDLGELLYKFQNTNKTISDEIWDEFDSKVDEFGENATFHISYNCNDDEDEFYPYFLNLNGYGIYYSQDERFDVDDDIQKAKDNIVRWIDIVKERKANLAKIVQYDKTVGVKEVEEWFLTNRHKDGDDMTPVDKFIGDTGIEMDILDKTYFSKYYTKLNIYTNGTDFVEADHFLIKELDGEWHVVKPITIDEYKAR